MKLTPEQKHQVTSALRVAVKSYTEAATALRNGANSEAVHQCIADETEETMKGWQALLTELTTPAAKAERAPRKRKTASTAA